MEFIVFFGILSIFGVISFFLFRKTKKQTTQGGGGSIDVIDEIKDEEEVDFIK